MPANIHCMDLAFFTCYWPWCTVQSRTHLGVLQIQNPPGLDNSWNLNNNIKEGLMIIQRVQKSLTVGKFKVHY